MQVIIVYNLYYNVCLNISYFNSKHRCAEEVISYIGSYERLIMQVSQTQVVSSKLGLTQWVHYILHIYPQCWIFYFPWHRHQIEGTTSFF